MTSIVWDLKIKNHLELENSPTILPPANFNKKYIAKMFAATTSYENNQDKFAPCPSFQKRKTEKKKRNPYKQPRPQMHIKESITPPVSKVDAS